MRRDTGFALIAVLWVVVALGGIVGLAAGAARLGQRESINRIALTRGRWAAEACLAIAQARWDEHALADTATVDLGGRTWCAWRLTDPTARLNVNTADSGVLATALCGGRSPCAADGLVRLRDTAPLTDLVQAAAVPGLDSASLALLTVDGPGTVNVNAAPAPILLALPGLGPEAVARIEMRRLAGRPYASLDALAADLSPPARAALLARYGDLARQVTFTAPALVLTALGWVDGVGAPDRLHATIELLAIPLQGRLTLVRRRMW